MLCSSDLDLLGKIGREWFRTGDSRNCSFVSLWSQSLMTKLPELDEGLLESCCFSIAEMPKALAGDLWSRAFLGGKFPAPCGNLLPASLFEVLPVLECGFVCPQLQPLFRSEKPLRCAPELQTSSFTSLRSHLQIGTEVELEILEPETYITE